MHRLGCEACHPLRLAQPVGSGKARQLVRVCQDGCAKAASAQLPKTFHSRSCLCSHLFFSLGETATGVAVGSAGVSLAALLVMLLAA